ncbi:response regulator [Hankyongella ginsenosidimutans]|uniref:histidine kinase n=1 Tax=Hankyongella ginsenosidimutans TaxID=1763828 RepID=A0A4D7CA26_9SPHN|nr:response regulator [Hankyongella ginsenosidimutans]QCI80013.1 response regulator [Hankyongella ginsenosidimutans]
MQLMNGTLSVESTYGIGSAFTLKMPVTIASEAAASKNPLESADIRVAVPKLRVLSVDDNPTNQMVMNVLLKALGQDVVLAGSGEDAIRLLQQERFDLVLLDLRMPKIDGFDVIAFVQEGQTPIPRRRFTPSLRTAGSRSTATSIQRALPAMSANRSTSSG